MYGQQNIKFLAVYKNKTH